jgi:hypothetical protein
MYKVLKFDTHIVLTSVSISYPMMRQFKPATKPYVGLVILSTVDDNELVTALILVLTAGKLVPVTVFISAFAVVHLDFI